MSNRESRAIVRDSAHKRSHSKEIEPPSMSNVTPLRIVLLGKSVSENSEVGNFILGRSVFDSEAPLDVVERVGGRLKHRHVILINSSQLLHANISEHQITQIARECVSLSDPGPHVVLLLLHHEHCSSQDQERLEKLQDYFSKCLLQHSMVLSTREPTQINDVLQKIIHQCSNRHFRLQRSSSPEDLLQAVEDIEKSNKGQHLLCTQYEASQRQGGRLNLLVCGSDSSLKSSISELVLQQTHRRSESVRTGVDLLLNVLELPALFNTGLSQEEVMCQTLRCVSCCHPGVHAFLLIIPDTPLNNQDRAELEEIQRVFSSRMNKYLMIIIKQNSEHQTAELNEETQAVIESFGGRHHFFGPKTQVSTLMENIEQMLEENRGGFFSTETFFEAQMKKLMMKIKFHSLETNLLTQDFSENTDDEVRIVLLGKTGVGKSATGNTILGRKVFKAEASFESVTKASHRESCEISGRQITVIDTPGLFYTELTNEDIQREIRHCISMILPGPHVFLLLVPLGRFTKEEETSVKIIQEMFGENSLMFTMVLFTRGDDLGNKTVEQCLGKPGSPLMNLIEACGHRFIVFNNNQTEDRTQVFDLLEKIDNMVKANGGSFYSCKMFREMEREKQEQQMKILMDRVREAEEEMKKLDEDKDRMKSLMEKLNRERKELVKNHEAEREKIKMMMEKEQENQDRERRRREEEFREREEQYKRLITEREQKENEMLEQIKLERMQWEKQKEVEKREGEKKEQEKTKCELHKKHQSPVSDHTTAGGETLKRKIPEYVKAVSSLPSRRIVLLGVNGVGKTAAAYVILGKREFASVLRINVATSVCSEAHATVSGRSVSVVDTPGLSDTQISVESFFAGKLMMEMSRSVYLSSPGPHAFLIVFRVDDRFIERELQILHMIEMMFGKEVLNYSIILFTHGDLLEGTTVEKLIEENSRLRALVQQCGGRYQLFNNKDLNNREQVNELLQMIDSMVQQNGGGHYTNHEKWGLTEKVKNCVCS